MSFTEILCRKFQPGDVLFPVEYMGGLHTESSCKDVGIGAARSQFKQKLRFVSKRASVKYRCLIFSSPVSRCLNIVNRKDTIGSPLKFSSSHIL